MIGESWSEWLEARHHHQLTACLSVVTEDGRRKGTLSRRSTTGMMRCEHPTLGWFHDIFGN